MSYIQQISIESANGPIKKIYDMAITRAGGVANIVQLMSLDPSVCQASLGLYMTAVRSDKSLDRSTREMLAAVVSNVNDCYY